MRKALVHEELDACGSPGEKVPRAGQKGVKGEWIQKVYDCVIACNSRLGTFSPMVVEDSESRPHKAEIFVVEREKEMQKWNEQKLPKVLPGYSVGGCQEEAQKKMAEKRRARRGQ